MIKNHFITIIFTQISLSYKVFEGRFCFILSGNIPNPKLTQNPKPKIDPHPDPEN